jgi:hypothetical protein
VHNGAVEFHFSPKSKKNRGSGRLQRARATSKTPRTHSVWDFGVPVRAIERLASDIHVLARHFVRDLQTLSFLWVTPHQCKCNLGLGPYSFLRSSGQTYRRDRRTPEGWAKRRQPHDTVDASPSTTPSTAKLAEHQDVPDLLFRNKISAERFACVSADSVVG